MRRRVLVHMLVVRWIGRLVHCVGDRSMRVVMVVARVTFMRHHTWTSIRHTWIEWTACKERKFPLPCLTIATCTGNTRRQESMFCLIFAKINTGTVKHFKELSVGSRYGRSVSAVTLTLRAPVSVSHKPKAMALSLLSSTCQTKAVKFQLNCL